MTEPIRAETSEGTFEGFRHENVRIWKGVEYARAERFSAPRQVESRRGVHHANAFAPQVPQGMGKRFMYDRPGFSEEGSLALNIWAPDEPGPHPVFFWIHGGAFVAGGSDMYSGEAFARDYGVVFVGINYRLGALGFGAFGETLGIPSIPSNLGIRDQIAALEWVQDHIAAFGGDPERVTIAGESAGSMSVSLLMLIERTRGLFHGAILQSGALNLIQGRETAHRLARRYAELLDLDQSSAGELRSLPLERIFAAQQQVGEEEKGGLPAAPYWDGDLLPASLGAAANREHAPVPMIAGYCREEMRLFERIARGILPQGRDQIAAILHAQLPAADAEAVLAEYPDTRKGNRALATDLSFAMPTRHFAEDHAAAGHPAWAYRFDRSTPIFGAAHAMDLLYLFPMEGAIASILRGGRLRGGHQRLAYAMRRHWAHFTHFGQPDEDWPRYLPESRKVMLFDKDSVVKDAPDPAHFEAWRDRIVAPRTTVEA